jgi:hypothetical protein
VTHVEPFCRCVVVLKCGAFFKIWRASTSSYFVHIQSRREHVIIHLELTWVIYVEYDCLWYAFPLWIQVSCSSTYFPVFESHPPSPWTNQGLGGTVWLPDRTCHKRMRAGFTKIVHRHTCENQLWYSRAPSNDIIAPPRMLKHLCSSFLLLDLWLNLQYTLLIYFDVTS